MTRFLKTICQILCVTYVLGLYSALAQADSFVIGSPHLEGLVNKDGRSGLLVKAVKEIFTRAGHQAVIKVFPSKRMPELLRQGEIDFVMPVLEIEMHDYTELKAKRSLPFIFRRDFVFVKKGRNVPTSVKDLEGFTLAATRGYGLDPRIKAEETIRYFITNSDEAAVKMVAKGRVDAYISDEFVVNQAIQKAGIEPLAHNPKKPLFTYGAALVTHHKSPVAALNRINRVIKEMWTDGTMKALLPFNNVEDFKPHAS